MILNGQTVGGLIIILEAQPYSRTTIRPHTHYMKINESDKPVQWSKTWTEMTWKRVGSPPKDVICSPSIPPGKKKN